MKRYFVYFMAIFFGFVLGIFATNDSSETQVTEASIKDKEAIIKEFREFVTSTDQKIRDEVKNFRQTTAKLAKERREMYEKLSDEAKKFIQKEKEFKKWLKEKQINAENNAKDGTEKQVSEDTK